MVHPAPNKMPNPFLALPGAQKAKKGPKIQKNLKYFNISQLQAGQPAGT